MRLTVYLNQNQSKMKKLLFFISLMPLASFAQKDYNPFEAIGKKVTVVTLSNGRYKETYGGDTVKRIGNVMFDIRTNKIVKFLEENDTTTYEFRKGGDLSTRWLSIDPLSAKYPYLSPYNFVTNNPIIYVDQDGRENIIYLVVANDKNGKASLKPETAQKIASEANKIYQNLGLKTRVVVYEGKEAFNPKYMDKTDAVAVVGNTKSQTTEYIKKNISSEFGKNLEENGFPSSKDNPESSENPSKKGGSIVAVGYNAVKEFYNWNTGSTEEQEAAFTIVHGAGHNATENHDSGIMNSAFNLKLSAFKLDNLTKNNVSNEDLISSMKKRFGTKDAKTNYSEKKKATGN